MINQILILKDKYIEIENIYDLLPQIVNTRKFYRVFKNYRYIIKSNRNEVFTQICEINNIILTKVFMIKNVDKLNKEKNESLIYGSKRIAIHYRSHDICLIKKKCINTKTAFNNVKRIYEEYKKHLLNYNVTNLLSSADENFSKLMIKEYNNVIQFRSDIHPVHSLTIQDKDNKNNEMIKIIGDISLLSKSDEFILSFDSTFSLLIFYMGVLDEYNNIKPHIFIDYKGKIVKKNSFEYVDLITRRNYFFFKNKKCSNKNFINKIKM